jgi:hypothetical protein
VLRRLVHVVIDCADRGRQARFWSAALGWEIGYEEPGEAGVWPAGYNVPWTVLADPEGSEFCVLTPR